MYDPNKEMHRRLASIGLRVHDKGLRTIEKLVERLTSRYSS